MLPSSVQVNPNSIAIDWTEMVLIPIIPTPTPNIYWWLATLDRAILNLFGTENW